MAAEFVMPKLGLTMEEGKIVEWLVADGTAVTAGTPVLRIETDKVESEVEATGSGRLHLVGEVGASFACGTLIGWFLAEGEAAPAAPVAAAPATAAPPAPAAAASAAPAVPADRARTFISPNARRVAGELGVDLAGITGTGPGGRIVSEDVRAAAAAAPTAPPAAAPGPFVAATKPATAAGRQLADLLGIDLALVSADPADGRVTRDAVIRYVRHRLGGPAEALVAPKPAPAPAAAPAAPAPAPAAKPAGPVLAPPMQEPSKVVKLTGVRGTIAKRMHGALQDMAQLTLFMDAEMDAVVADRTARKDGGGTVPSFTDYIVCATARALRDHPMVNSQVIDKGIALLPEIHVGFAVAVPNGLLVPVVRNADRLAITDLAVETKRLAEAGRAGQLKLPDLEGGTFSVSALGMFGVDGFTPVINPPNTAILGVGRLREDVVLRNGTAAAATRLTLSLTWDHRVIDGAPAAEFTQSIVKYLADPASLATAPA